MPGLEQLDHTHALIDGLTSIWRRLFIFLTVGFFAHFVGGNIHGAPDFIASVQAVGFAAIADLRTMDFAWMPLEWIGTVLVSFLYPPTMIYPLVFLAAFLTTLRADDVPFWAIALLIVGQPIDTFLVRQYWSPLTGTNAIIANVLLGVYAVMAIAGCFIWWRVRQVEEE